MKENDLFSLLHKSEAVKEQDAMHGSNEVGDSVLRTFMAVFREDSRELKLVGGQSAPVSNSEAEEPQV